MISQYILLISAIIAVGLSALSSIIPIGGYDQGEVSAIYDTLLTPATFTFSIWGLIYLSWFVLGVLVALKKISVSKQNTYTLAAAQVLSSLWLIPSQSLYLFIALVIILAVAYLLFITVLEMQEESAVFKIVTELFFGWLFIASMLNISLVLVQRELYFFPILISALSIVVIFFVYMYLYKRFNAIIPLGVFLWALIGVIAGQDNTYIVFLAGGAILAALAGIFYFYPGVKALRSRYELTLK